MPARKIQMIIRDAGLASRREAEELIRQGMVTINGQVVRDPAARADLEHDHIKVSGKLLRPFEQAKSYYLLNKPRNLVSTFSDPQGRPSLGDLVRPSRRGLFTIGRLDFDAEGLMILTNDGAFAQKMAHPSYAVPRTYLVKVGGEPDDKTLARMKRGMNIGGGDRIGEIKWDVIKRQKTSTWIKVVLFEGKKNELKRIFTVIRHPVRKIRRIGFGPFFLGKLPVGQWRPMIESEIDEVKALLDPARTRPEDKKPLRGPTRKVRDPRKKS